MKNFLKELPHWILNFLTMPCKQVVLKADLSDVSFSDVFKMTLHLVLCKPCSKYVKSNSDLQKAIHHYLHQSDPKLNSQLEDLNKKLLQKMKP